MTAAGQFVEIACGALPLRHRNNSGRLADDSGKAVGSFGKHGDGSGDLAMPKGVAADKDGVVYVVDGLFDHVQLFNRRGDFLLTVGGRGSDFGEFWLPSGIFIDAENMMYICDTYNRSVQVFRVTDNYTDGTLSSGPDQ